VLIVNNAIKYLLNPASKQSFEGSNPFSCPASSFYNRLVSESSWRLFNLIWDLISCSINTVYNSCKMTKLCGEIRDSVTGNKVPARVQILSGSGELIVPSDSIRKIGPGEPFFYSEGYFEVETTAGYHQILIEKGTEYEPWKETISVTNSSTTTKIEANLNKWNLIGQQGWHPGNTHLHYDEKEENPDERLSLDPRIEDLRMTAVSILKRWDLEYATNKYSPGFLSEFSDLNHHVQCGEESRHNKKSGFELDSIGYGHVMLLDINNVISPISTGVLVDKFEPDYPPLTYVCDQAKSQNGLVIWCHNGQGMEAPIAGILGKLDAINLFDPFWTPIEYTIWYHMLNCGLKIPASTGSDWFVSSANRIYSYTGGKFNYQSWIKSLKDGNSFISNGPALFLEVNDQPMGRTVNVSPESKINTKISWSSFYDIDQVELIYNGNIVENNSINKQEKSGTIEKDITVPNDGWIAARIKSKTRDSFFQPVWAHSSPTYISTGKENFSEKNASAKHFVKEIDRSLEWVSKKGKFYSDKQRKEILDLHKKGRSLYKKLQDD